MSIVIVHNLSNEIIMGADSYISESNGLSDWQKLKSYKDIHVGFAGYLQEGNLFYEYIKYKPPKKPTVTYLLKYYIAFVKWSRDLTGGEWVPNGVSGASKTTYFLVFKNKVFFIDDYIVTEIKENTYHAIGAGCDHAIGAMDAGANMEKALAITCKRNNECSEPLNIITIPKHKKK